MKKNLIILLTIIPLSLSAQPPALRNFGNSCYVNALIQALYATKPLNNLLLSTEVPLEFISIPARTYKDLVINFINGNQSAIDAALFDFYNSIKGVYATGTGAGPSQPPPGIVIPKQEQPAGRRQPVGRGRRPTPKSALEKAIEESRKEMFEFTKQHAQLITTIARAKNPTFDKLSAKEKQDIQYSISDVLNTFNQERQQDAHEFLMYILKELQKIAPTQAEELFFYLLSNNEQDAILNIPTYTPAKVVIDYAMVSGQYQLLSEISYFDSLYEGLKKALRGYKIAITPSIFICALNRTVSGRNIDTTAISSLKIRHPVRIPFILNLSPYTTGDEPTAFDLYAIAVHRGLSANAGHYVTYVKHNNQWYLCNDMQIKPVTAQAVRNEIETDGYILFYQRIEEYFEEEEPVIIEEELPLEEPEEILIEEPVEVPPAQKEEEVSSLEQALRWLQIKLQTLLKALTHLSS